MSFVAAILFYEGKLVCTTPFGFRKKINGRPCSRDLSSSRGVAGVAEDATTTIWALWEVEARSATGARESEIGERRHARREDDVAK